MKNPLINSQDKVKKTIDQQQDALIKQLKENQQAITTGLDRLNEDNQRVLELNESAGVQMRGETKSSDLGRIFNTEDLYKIICLQKFIAQRLDLN